MGLLDTLFGGAPADPNQMLGQFTDPRLQIAAGLLSGHGNLGANLSTGLLGAATQAQAQRNFAMTQQATERANRTNDLQQISGVYNILKNQDMMQAVVDMKAGRPHVPSPALSQVEQKMYSLAGMPTMAGGSPQPSPGGMPQPGPAQPAMPASPVGQNFRGANPDYQPLPQPQGAQPQQLPQPSQPNAAPQRAANPLQDQIDMADMIALGSGKPDLMAQNIYARSKLVPTRNGVYIQDPSNPMHAILAGGMIPQGAMNVQMGPNGPTIAPLPGQLATNAQTAAATSAGTAAGRFPFETTNVTRASGATVPQLMSSAVGQPNLGQLASLFGQSPAASPPPPAVSRPQVPPAVSAAAARGQPFVATQAPGGAVQFQQPPQAGTQTADPFASVPQRYSPQGLGQSTFDKNMAEKQASSASEIATKLGTQADAANQRIALNNQALELVDKADTGPMAVRIGDLKNWLVSRFNVPENDFANSPSADMALQKDLVNAATQKAKQQFGSRITQSEVNLMLTRGAPNVDMTKAALNYLLKSDNALLGYQVKQADDFGKYLQQGGDPMRFEAWYARQFPASKDLSAVQLNTGAPNIDALVNKYKSH